jgi:hypothetical protein
MDIESTALGPQLYVASHDKVKVFNVTVDNYPPAFVGQAATPSSSDVAGRFATDGKAYVTNLQGGGFQVFNITNPGSPQLVGTLSATGDARALHEHGDLALVCDMDGRVLVINVANPSQPVVVKVHELFEAPTNCAGVGSLTYISAGTELLSNAYGVDLSSPFAPIEPFDTAEAGKGVFATAKQVYFSGRLGSTPPTRIMDAIDVSFGPKGSLSWPVRFEVIDGAGDTAESTVFVWANSYNGPPQAQVAVLGVIDGMTVAVSSADSSDPDEETTWDGYKESRFDFQSDGIWDCAFFPSPFDTATFTYPVPGTYTITAQVRDRYGAFSTATTQVTVPQ